MPGLITLVIETSTPAASLALFRAGDLIDGRSFTSDRHHNAHIFEPLSDLLKSEAGQNVSQVLVGSGPGSYSGTRVGIAAAQGVAIAMGCPAIAIPSLLAVPQAQNGAACLAIGDARRGHFWTASIGGNRLESDPEIQAESAFQAQVELALDHELAVFSFEDPARYHLPQTLGDLIQFAVPQATLLHACWTAADGFQRDHWAAAIPQPIYLQPPHITPAKRPWLLRAQP